MNWITESNEKFQPFCHFTQSYIELRMFFPSSITEVCIGKSQIILCARKIYYRIRYTISSA